MRWRLLLSFCFGVLAMFNGMLVEVAQINHPSESFLKVACLLVGLLFVLTCMAFAQDDGMHGKEQK